MTINNRPIPSIRQVQNERSVQPATRNRPEAGGFQNILNQQLLKKDGVKFSRHAESRLNSRSIDLTQEQIQRLNNGIDKAKAKGIRESLVLMDNIALVVNVESNTVVTALDQSEATDHVFTNIDGAVVL